MDLAGDGAEAGEHVGEDEGGTGGAGGAALASLRTHTAAPGRSALEARAQPAMRSLCCLVDN